jgi:hypothetical protein
MFLEAVGIITISLLVSPTVSGALLAVPLFVYGIGVGLATAQLTSIVLSDIPAQRSGLASGANSTMRQVGSALGIAILGTVLFSTLVSGTEANIAAAGLNLKPECAALVSDLVNESAGQILPALKNPSAAGNESFSNFGTLPPAQLACFRDPAFTAALPKTALPIENAFVDATRLAGLVASGFVLIGVVLTLLLPSQPAHRQVAPEVTIEPEPKREDEAREDEVPAGA